MPKPKTNTDSKSKSNEKPPRDPLPAGAVYVGTQGVCKFFGGRSRMWISRKLQNDARFPRPVYFGKLPHWHVKWLELYAAEAPTTPEQGVAR